MASSESTAADVHVTSETTPVPNGPGVPRRPLQPACNHAVITPSSLPAPPAQRQADAATVPPVRPRRPLRTTLPAARMRWLRAAGICVLPVLAACGTQPVVEPAVARPQWFCSTNQGERWDCVQSTDIATMTAVAARSPAAGAAAPADDATTPQQAPATATPRAPATPPAAAALPSTPGGGGAPEGSVPQPSTPQRAGETAGAPLADLLDGAPPPDAVPRPLPDEPRMRRIGDLPPDHWSIQVIAFANRAQLEAFAAEYDLYRHPAARIESNGAIRYVLLWDHYATRAEAEAALATLPPVIRALNPWLRTVG
jgi:hypothetical protein